MRENFKKFVFGVFFLSILVGCGNSNVVHYNTNDLVTKLNSLSSDEVIKLLGEPDNVTHMDDYKIFGYSSDDDKPFYEEDEAGNSLTLYVRIDESGYVMSVGN